MKQLPKQIFVMWNEDETPFLMADTSLEGLLANTTAGDSATVGVYGRVSTRSATVTIVTKPKS